MTSLRALLLTAIPGVIMLASYRYLPVLWASIFHDLGILLVCVAGLVVAFGVADWRKEYRIDCMNADPVTRQLEILDRMQGEDKINFARQIIGAPGDTVIRLIDTREGYHEERIPLPATPEQLRAIAEGVGRGVTFSEENWTGRNGIISKPKFAALREVFVNRGLLVQRNPTAPAQGFEFTVAGLHMLKEYNKEEE